MLAPLAAARRTEVTRTYDLCIAIAGRRLYWRNRNHDITLGSDCIAWTMDANAIETPYGNIVAVHLNSVGQKVTADQCTITFADNSRLLVVNTDAGGYRDAGQAVLYRDFVRDLHAHLAPERYPGIRFSAGLPRARYWTMLLSAAFAAPAFAFFGLVDFYVLHLSNGLVLFAIGEYFCWTLGRRALINRPRDYTPDKLPEALLR